MLSNRSTLCLHPCPLMTHCHRNLPTALGLRRLRTDITVVQNQWLKTQTTLLRQTVITMRIASMLVDHLPMSIWMSRNCILSVCVYLYCSFFLSFVFFVLAYSVITSHHISTLHIRFCLHSRIMYRRARNHYYRPCHTIYRKTTVCSRTP